MEEINNNRGLRGLITLAVLTKMEIMAEFLRNLLIVSVVVSFLFFIAYLSVVYSPFILLILFVVAFAAIKTFAEGCF